jgi:hypothetical protein
MLNKWGKVRLPRFVCLCGDNVFTLDFLREDLSSVRGNNFWWGKDRIRVGSERVEIMMKHY